VLISAGLRFAENSDIKIEHYGLSTLKGSAMVWRVMLNFRLPPTADSSFRSDTIVFGILLGFLCKDADLIQPASLCRLRAVPELCRTFGDRSHPAPPTSRKWVAGNTKILMGRTLSLGPTAIEDP
jgi:hypothetical protein